MLALSSFWRCDMTEQQIPTTEHLIELIERAALVPEDSWSDRDTPRSVGKLGKAWAYLKAGCSWRLAVSPESNPDTWWIEITHLSFDSFEYGRDPEHAEVELFYLPTKEHLDRVNGKDWY